VPSVWPRPRLDKPTPLHRVRPLRLADLPDGRDHPGRNAQAPATLGPGYVVGPGSAATFDVVVESPGAYPLVTHSLTGALRGAIAVLGCLALCQGGLADAADSLEA